MSTQGVCILGFNLILNVVFHLHSLLQIVCVCVCLHFTCFYRMTILFVNRDCRSLTYDCNEYFTLTMLSCRVYSLIWLDWSVLCLSRHAYSLSLFPKYLRLYVIFFFLRFSTRHSQKLLIDLHFLFSFVETDPGLSWYVFFIL